MGLVSDDRIGAVLEFGDLVEDEWELLEGGDDDSGGAAGECLSQLFLVLIDLPDETVGVF